MKRLNFSAGGLVLLAVLNPVTCAQAAQVFNEQVVISHLNTKLTDLNPTDGVAPSLNPTLDVYGHAATVGLGATSSYMIYTAQTVYTAYNVATVDGSILDASTGQAMARSGQNIADKTAQGLSVQVTGDEASVSDLMKNLGYYRGHGLGGSSDAGTSSASLWLLSAGTELEVTGQVNWYNMLDARLLTSLNFANVGTLELTGKNGVNLSLQVADGEAVPTDAYANGQPATYNFSQSFLQRVNQSGVSVTQADNAAGAGTFTLRLRNSGTTALTVALNMNMWSSLGLVPTTQPVPEPATWALMSLGLGCMVWRQRTRQS